MFDSGMLGLEVNSSEPNFVIIMYTKTTTSLALRLRSAVEAHSGNCLEPACSEEPQRQK